jgi:hypothetical protein
MDEPPVAVVAAANRLRSGCRCSWTAADQNTVIAWLSPRLREQPQGFPLVLSQRGTSWWLEKA